TNCTSASLTSITGTGPWTINITYSCGNNQSFNVVYGPVTAPTTAGTTTFTSSPVTTSPAVTVTGAAAVAANSTITGTSPVVANDVATSTVSITLLDACRNPVSGVTPTFSATDTGSTNVYGACSATNASGVSTCTLASTKAEVKTLSIATPVVKSGGTVTFTAGPAAAANSAITGTSPVVANGLATATATRTPHGAGSNPVGGAAPTG